MSDRLQELRRQRALAADQLAWLDREIAAASGQPAVAPTPPSSRPALAPVVSSNAPVAPTPVESPEVAAAADAILQDYRVDPAALKTDVKKGCFRYFYAALALFALCVAAIYFFYSR
jgi:hypothetical protein